MSTLSRKARADLTRHRARTLLAVGTLSIAIASLGFLAVPLLLNAAMNRQIAGSHLYDVGISTSILDLSPAQLRALGRLPGVAAVSPAVGYATTMTSAAGPQDAELVGTALATAPVNTVALFTGRMPGPGAILADAGNTRATGYAVPVGATIDVRAASGRLVRLRVSGTGLNLYATPGANGSSTPVFYAPTATVQALHSVRGYNYLGFRLADDSTAAQSKVIAEVRAYLTAQTGVDPITALPAVRSPGQWPGQSGFGQVMALLYIVTILALASALFLIAATMNTLVAEQASEIAILKTLGGRQCQIAGITMRTAAMLGAASAAVGTILGIAIADLLAGYFAVKLIDVSFGFAISVPVIAASLVAGPALAVAASLPALRRALRQPVAETLAGTGTSRYGSSRLDRLAARGGLGAHPLYSYRLTAGHWFTTADTAADARTAIPPVVLGPALARAAQASVGQILTLSLAAGPTRVRVIGIDTVPTSNGDTVYFPLPALERLDGGPGTADSIWLATASPGHAAIDRATAAAASRLAAAGYQVSTTEIYVTQAQITASDTAILAIVEILGLVVVAIMLMGLVSALSMGVIERTREVGILRCVGARARHIRRVFSAEAMILAVAGWAFGVLLGWLIYQGLLTLLLHDAALSLPQEFPLLIPLMALAGVLALTLIVIRGPLRRATRIQPGSALRYQ